MVGLCTVLPVEFYNRLFSCIRLVTHHLIKKYNFIKRTQTENVNPFVLRSVVIMIIPSIGQ